MDYNSDSGNNENSGADDEEEIYPKHQHDLHKNRKPSNKYKYGMNTTTVGDAQGIGLKP